MLPKPRGKWFGTILMSVIRLPGAGMIMFTISSSTPVVATISLAMGYVNINFMTRLQRRIPEQLIGLEVAAAEQKESIAEILRGTSSMPAIRL